MCFDRSVMICVGATTEVKALKKALAEAEEKAAKEQAARKKLKTRLNEVQQELQDAVKKCETLERDVSAQETELAKARQSAEEAWVEAQGALRENQETRIWSSPGAFVDLPRSVFAAAEFFRAEEGRSTEKLFLSQYLAIS